MLFGSRGEGANKTQVNCLANQVDCLATMPNTEKVYLGSILGRTHELLSFEEVYALLDNRFNVPLTGAGLTR